MAAMGAMVPFSKARAAVLGGGVYLVRGLGMGWWGCGVGKLCMYMYLGPKWIPNAVDWYQTSEPHVR